MPDTTDIMDSFMDGFSDDYVAEETEVEETETVESSAEEEGTEEETDTTEEEVATSETEPVEADPETIDYSYNHQTTALPYASIKSIAEKLGKTPSEVVTILQKGSNYDTLQGRQTPFQAAIDRINRFADISGMSREDSIARTIEALDVIESARYMEELKAQYPGADARMLQDMAMMRVRESANTPTKAETDAKAEEEKAEEKRAEMWKGFFRSHPEVTPDNLSDRMLKALEEHEDPEYVYAKEQNTILLNKIKELENKQQKKARSTGSSKGTSGKVGADAFLDAFFS